MIQKDAVYEAIKRMKPDMVDSDRPVTLSKQEKELVKREVFEGIKNRRVQYGQDPLPSDDKLELYVSGLVSNWMRKDKRLNGHTTYSPRRPGSRSASVVADGPDIPQEDIDRLRSAAHPGDTVVLIRHGTPHDTSAHE